MTTTTGAGTMDGTDRDDTGFDDPIVLSLGDHEDNAPRHMAEKMPPRTTVRQRIAVMVAYLLVIVALVDGSSMRGSGDAADYLVMSDRLAHFHQPTITADQIPGYQKLFGEIGGYWGLGVNVAGITKVPQANGQYPFNHFWSYSLVTAPVLRVTDALGFNPVRAFTIVNVIMLMGALWVVLKRLHWLPAMLIFAGPVFWWVDKVHSEVFTFSLLAAGSALLASRRPVWAMVLFAVAASQNFPIAGAVGLAWLVAVAQDRTRLRSWKFWAASAISALLSLASVIYYEITLGVYNPQSLNEAVSTGIPSAQQYLAPILDLNVGLLVAAPIILATTFAALIATGVLWRRTDWITVGAIVITGLWFLFSFAQTTNVNHGATPSLTRYALWLMPLAIGLFVHLDRIGALNFEWKIPRLNMPVEPIAIGLVAMSVIISIVAFAPKLPDGLNRPTPVASWVWNNHPSWDNPLPEVFLERVQAYPDWSADAAATPGCSKVITIHGKWPSHCGTAPQIPEKCGGGCYANRHGDGYDFVVTRADPAFFNSPSFDRGAGNK